MKILAIGDSWFDYPDVLLTGGGVPGHLSRIIGVPIQNIAHHGDGSEVTLSIRKRKEIEENLPADIILVSMGGDDIAGDQFCLWLNDNSGQGPIGAVDTRRLAAILDLVCAVYLDLEKIRDDFAPGALIVTHEYDFPPAGVLGQGVCGLGPWLQPSLKFCGWDDLNDQQAIVHGVLATFAARMRNLPISNRIHVQTQGTLGVGEWGNEIHPNRQGFQKIAEKIADALQPYLPHE